MIPLKSKLLISISLALTAIGQQLLQYKNQNIKIPECYQVVYIYDGDTIKVNLDGKEEKIRLLGIDTPEMNYESKKKPDCYAQNAKDKLKNMIGNSCIKLKSDKLSGDKDKYDRLLRYIYLPDGKFLNMELVKQGYAFNYIYSDNELKKDFSQAELNAKNKKLGIWSLRCDYNKN